MPNEAMSIIIDWLKNVGLEVAEHKTEVVLITNQKNKESVKFRAGKHLIKSKDDLKYLRIIIDGRLKFKAHLKYATEKVSKVHEVLPGLLSNFGKPKQKK